MSGMPKMTLITKVGLALLSTFLVCACSTQAHRVDCDGPLVPINAPVLSLNLPTPQSNDVQP